MLVLALDTSTRSGSVAILRDGILDSEIGDAARTYGERLPGDIAHLLDRHGLAVREIDLFAVAAGPGSFTGLRIGIATMQGFALANGRRIVGVSTLDALNAAGRLALSPQPSAPQSVVAVWLDAHRGEVFSALYGGDSGSEPIEGPTVEKPGDVLARWTARPDLSHNMTFIGDGALVYAAAIREALPGAAVAPTVPSLAPAIALLAAESAARNETQPPDAIRPIYLRRPDVELARERRASRGEPGTLTEPRTLAEPRTPTEPRTPNPQRTQHQAPTTPNPVRKP